MQADLYIRVSTEEQKLHGFSQRYQEEILRLYCNVNLLSVDKVILEDHSAKTFDRPQWNKLFSGYKSRKGNERRLLLVTQWDRFSRNTGDAYAMISQLSKLNVEVRAVEQPLDLTIPETKVMMAYYLAIPEVENERRGLNIRQGLHRATKEGRFVGVKPPVGYRRRVDEMGYKYIEPIEPYAGFVRMGFEELASGVRSVRAIFELLVAHGFDRSENCFREVIRNPLYCGLVKVNGEEANYVAGKHTPIITKELFDQVQDRLERRKVSCQTVAPSKMLPLRGLLYCPRCKKKLTGSGSRGRWGNRYYYYHCKSTCGTRFTTGKVHGQLQVFLKGLSMKPFFEVRYKEFFQHLSGQETVSHVQKKLRLQQSIVDLQERLRNARDLLLAQEIDTNDYKSIREDILKKIELLEETIHGKTKAAQDSMALTLAKQDLGFQLDVLYNGLDVTAKIDLALSLFPKGLVYSDTCFSFSNMAPWIRYIYQGDHKWALPRDAGRFPAPGEQDVSLLHESVFVKKQVLAIVEELDNLPIRIAVQIIHFFRKLCKFSMTADNVIKVLVVILLVLALTNMFKNISCGSHCNAFVFFASLVPT